MPTQSFYRNAKLSKDQGASRLFAECIPAKKNASMTVTGTMVTKLTIP